MKATIIHALPADKIVGDLIWTPKGEAFYALTTDGVLSRVSLDGCVVEKQVVLGSLCKFLALSAEGLLVAKKDSMEVLVVDASSFEVKKEFYMHNLERFCPALIFTSLWRLPTGAVTWMKRSVTWTWPREK